MCAGMTMMSLTGGPLAQLGFPLGTLPDWKMRLLCSGDSPENPFACLRADFLLRLFVRLSRLSVEIATSTARELVFGMRQTW